MIYEANRDPRLAARLIEVDRVETGTPPEIVEV
jgi:hypothetical protein